ncbi:Membrane protein of ER body-like protein [Camellia lanceoleosa]|uniref:Membrane protein of ER body-like protein n=1 Tax=Camellia lanceoleosa TaxID=1840588 RepID=A0ACC0IYT0_9ERIC|nr:Membrane protein of ER body-like protein [Camellia lanceoleosa]
MEKTEQWQQEEEVEETEEEEEGATVALLGQQWEKNVTAVEEDEVSALALQGQQWEEEEEEVKERDKDAAALALQGQQWGQEEVEEEEMVEVKERDKNAAALALQGQQWGQEEVEEEKVDAVALQGRRPRHLTTTTATAIEVSDASKIDLMLPSSEPANADGGEFQEQDTNDVVELVLDSAESSKKSVYSDKVQGTESFLGFFVTGKSGIKASASEKNHRDDRLVDDSFSGFRPLPSEKSFKEHKTNNLFSDVTVACDDIEQIKDSDQEFTELDVERVLEKQDTHDLYCPNCNSCITRRVILRKRKRKIRISDEDLKRNKSETVVAPEIVDAIPSDATNDQGLTPAADEYNRVREPEIFTCLSCLSFFIRTGDCFKKDNKQSPQQISAMIKNWFSSIFASRKEDMLIDQGVEENIVGAVKQEDTSPPESVGAQGLVKSGIAEPQEVGDDNVPSSTQSPKLIGEVIADVGDKLEDATKKSREGAALDHPELVTVNQSDSSSFSNKMVSNEEIDRRATQISGRTPVHTEEPVAIESISSDDKDLTLLSPQPVSVLGKSDINETMNIVADLPAEDVQNVGADLSTGSVVEDKIVEAKLSDADYSAGVSQHADIGTKVDIPIEEPLKADTDVVSLSVQDDLLIQDRQDSITKDSEDMPEKSIAAGSDTIIIVKEEPVEPAAPPQEAQDIITSAETEVSAPTDIAKARRFPGLEIMKSILYGGLIESITSLGVVSSAAGADATTLNILALALANLIGGLFLIAHQLWELKNENSGVTSNQATEGESDQVTQQQEDRYQELLGRRENFWLHAPVTLLSFLIVGSLPPVIYAFTFPKSNNSDFKLIAVAVASLLCIILLAIGKAYIQRPPKAYIKTVVYYVIMGFMASGVSYAAADLIKMLLEKLGWFDSDLLLTLPETTTKQPGWGSY